MQFASQLPIDAVLDDIAGALDARGAAILVAPPGAGKTTRVPLALLDAPWRKGGKIIVLEPRRIAARAAAERMASTLGERLGETIGLRARLASRTGPRVAVEVVTEGVFTRMILDDPSLQGVAGVLFDEFHERSLDADLGLALALDARDGLRPDLRLLVMSATLEAGRVAALLDAPVIESEGRAFPIVTRYLGRPRDRIEDGVTDAVARAVREENGSVLAFLPGQGEIVRTAERLRERIADPNVDITPLYGALDPATQDRAIAPAPAGRRKVVLATSIAETSITIEGVRVVVDSGLARVPRFEPDIGVTRLETVRVSRAAADQRRGRAGRTEPGVCYRLWDEPETQGLLPFAEPEMRAADLSSLLLDCAEWGADPRTLRWLDPPAEGPLAAARTELQAVGALDPDGRITDVGKRLRALPLPPRLARMVLAAAELGSALQAAEIAAVIVERGIGGNDVDLDTRLERFRRDRGRRADDMRRLARGWAASAFGKRFEPGGAATSTARLLALAYPDRIAKARGPTGQFLLANGRAGSVDATDHLARAPYLVVAELQGRAGATRITLAAAANEDDIAAVAGDAIVEREEVAFDMAARAVRARRVKRLGAITLVSEQRAVPGGEDVSAALAAGVSQIGIGELPWSKAQQQLRRRVAFLRETDVETWPDLSDAALAASVETWLQPFLTGRTRFSEVDAEVLDQALHGLLPWALRQRLDADAPTHFEAPTGNRHALDYDGTGAPSLHIRVQELFGLKEHPAIARGRLPLTLHLLSPAHRPIQITRDLPGFWKGSWSAVRSDMRGQYPRHVWPEDPANAAPTARAKPRGT